MRQIQPNSLKQNSILHNAYKKGTHSEEERINEKQEKHLKLQFILADVDFEIKPKCLRTPVKLTKSSKGK